MNYFQKQRSYCWNLIRTETCLMGDEIYHEYEVGLDDFGFSVYRKKNLETLEGGPVLLTISYGEGTWVFQLWPI